MRFGIAVGVLGLALSAIPWVLEIDEAVGLGALFRFRGPVEPPGDVVVVSVSRDAAAAVGQGSELDEWRRAVHADLIDAVTRAGAASVIFDIIFDKPREPAEDDRRLATAIERAGNVVLAERVDLLDAPSPAGAVTGIRDARARPLPAFEHGALGTAPFTLPTVPYRVSQLWLFGRGEPDLPSLPAVALQAHWLEHYDALVGLLRAARPTAALEIPLTAAELREHGQLQTVMQSLRRLFRADPTLAADAVRLAHAAGTKSPELERLIGLYSGGDSRYVNYYGPARTIRTVPYDEALNRASELGLAGKTLFVGYSEHRQPEQQDSFNSVFSERTGIELGGVEIGATAFGNLLEGRSLVALAMPTHLLLVLGFGVLAGAGLGRLRPRAAAAAAIVAGVAYFAIVYWLFDARGVWLPLAVPLVVQLPGAFALTMFASYVDSDRQRVRVQTVLGYYVPENVVKRLAEQSVSMEASRQLVHGTCLFTDAEQYTTVSESLHPEELRALMNDYYEVMFDVVTRHGGYVSDTSGDSMVAVWTTATPDPALRARACEAAVEIVAAVAAFNRDRGRQQLPTRVGLESGELVLGNIGAAQRFEYRAIGDIVNTASRLQGLNRLLGTRVLISGATLDGTGVAARDLGRFLLRGKTQPVRVYEPVAARNGERSAQWLDEFRAALACFERCAWKEAHARFAALAEALPDDGPTTYYEQLAAALERAPPADWPGFVTVDVK